MDELTVRRRARICAGQVTGDGRAVCWVDAWWSVFARNRRSGRALAGPPDHDDLLTYIEDKGRAAAASAPPTA